MWLSGTYERRRGTGAAVMCVCAFGNILDVRRAPIGVGTTSRLPKSAESFLTLAIHLGCESTPPSFLHYSGAVGPVETHRGFGCGRVSTGRLASTHNHTSPGVIAGSRFIQIRKF